MSSTFFETESVQKPLLAGLGAGLEKFLDVIGEIQPVSETVTTKATAGFALTFPHRGATGVFLLADEGGVLPSWHRNPGVAGRTRLELFARGLATLFAPNETVPESTVPTEAFLGRVAPLDEVLRELESDEKTQTFSFRIHRFDGRTGWAWMLSPVSCERLARFVERIPEETVSTELKPVRALETCRVENTVSEGSSVSFSPRTSVETTFQPANLLEEGMFTTVCQGDVVGAAKLEEAQSAKTLFAGKVLDVPVIFSARTAMQRFSLQTLLSLKVGDVLAIGPREAEPFEIFLGEHCIGTGFAVEYEGRLGVECTRSTSSDGSFPARPNP